MRETKGTIRLGRLELQIMDAVWQGDSATVREALDRMRPARHAYSTILTMMRKLEAKGYLRHETEGRAFRYFPTITQQEVRRSAVSDLLDRLFGGSGRLVVSHLVEQKQINRGELDEIRRLIDKRRKGR